MEFRALGGSGLKVSAVSYGNWLTHGSEIDPLARGGLNQAATNAQAADHRLSAETMAGVDEVVADPTPVKLPRWPRPRHRSRSWRELALGA